MVLDPALRLAVDIFPCEDGHAQERRLFGAVLERIKPRQLWIADRNMCTLEFLSGIAQRQSAFVIREHQNLPWQALDELQSVAVVEAGELLEQPIQIEFQEQVLRLRRIVLRLSQPTRHGDQEIVVLSNLPVTTASAMVVSKLYRERWQVEGLFLSVTTNFEGEIKSLAYPKAALLSFSLALISYNILATLRAALSSVHGIEQGEKVSDFYVVDEIQGTYRGMMIAIAPEHWQCFSELSLTALAELLKQLAAQVNLKRFYKQPRKVRRRPRHELEIPNIPMSQQQSFYLAAK